MGSDENTMLKPEWFADNEGKGVRLFAYSCALSFGFKGRYRHHRINERA